MDLALKHVDIRQIIYSPDEKINECMTNITDKLTVFADFIGLVVLMKRRAEIKRTIYSVAAAHKIAFIGLITFTISVVSLSALMHNQLEHRELSSLVAADLMQECVKEATQPDCWENKPNFILHVFLPPVFVNNSNTPILILFLDFYSFVPLRQLSIKWVKVISTL